MCTLPPNSRAAGKGRSDCSGASWLPWDAPERKTREICTRKKEQDLPFSYKVTMTKYESSNWTLLKRPVLKYMLWVACRNKLYLFIPVNGVICHQRWEGDTISRWKVGLRYVIIESCSCLSWKEPWKPSGSNPLLWARTLWLDQAVQPSPECLQGWGTHSFSKQLCQCLTNIALFSCGLPKSDLFHYQPWFVVA